MWPALAVIVASMFANYMNNRSAQQRASSLQSAMQTYQQTKARENEAAINQLANQQTPQARGSELSNIEASRQQSMQDTVNAARAASPVTAAAGTNTSRDYQQASEAAASRVAERTKRIIEQQAVIGAPGEQGIATGLRFGRVAGNVDANNAAINNIGEAYSRDIAGVRPNPWVALLSRAGMAVGGYMLGGPAGGAVAAGSNYPTSSGGVVTGYGGAGDVASDPNLVANADGTYSTRRARLNNALAQWGYGN
jgi:hypothetical protein